jgi:hypothetical protein
MAGVQAALCSNKQQAPTLTHSLFVGWLYTMMGYVMLSMSVGAVLGLVARHGRGPGSNVQQQAE